MSLCYDTTVNDSLSLIFERFKSRQKLATIISLRLFSKVSISKLGEYQSQNKPGFCVCKKNTERIE